LTLTCSLFVLAKFLVFIVLEIGYYAPLSLCPMPQTQHLLCTVHRQTFTCCHGQMCHCAYSAHLAVDSCHSATAVDLQHLRNMPVKLTSVGIISHCVHLFCVSGDTVAGSVFVTIFLQQDVLSSAIIIASHISSGLCSCWCLVSFVTSTFVPSETTQHISSLWLRHVLSSNTLPPTTDILCVVCWFVLFLLFSLQSCCTSLFVMKIFVV